jgi:hypothetical protein
LVEWRGNTSSLLKWKSKKQRHDAEAAAQINMQYSGTCYENWEYRRSANSEPDKTRHYINHNNKE